MSSTCRACESGYEEPHSCGYTDEPPEQKPTSVIFDVLMGDPLAQLDRIEAKLDQLLAKKKPAKPRSRKQVTGNEFFDKFWDVYPLKKSKKAAMSAFKNLSFTVLVDDLIADVKNRMANDNQWVEGYIPHAATYLNGELWNDDITPIPQKKTSEDPDKQHHKTFDPDAKVVIVDGINPYEDM